MKHDMNEVITAEFDENGRAIRRIRSFVRRQGRLTKGQQLALEQYWPLMGVEFTPEALDLPTLFGRQAPVVLEIGFGMGASLVTMAEQHPERDFLGIEVHSPGAVSYTHLTLPTITSGCRSRWSPYH